MHVIAHEHISVKDKPAFLSVYAQTLKELAAVGFIKKDILSLIASDNDVVKSPFKLYAWFSCHS
jgi:hypothetical protein